MSRFAAALWAEFLKARRSKVPTVTALGFALAPIMGGLFMIILKDPEYARSIGLIGAKAQIVAGTADWPTYLGVLAQAGAVGGIFVFGTIAIWVFGREYADRTATDLMALPTSRPAIVAAKFVVVIAWSFALAAMIYVLGLAIAAAIGLPGWSPGVTFDGALSLAVTASLTIALGAPVAFVASAGRGYLPPMGFVILMIFFSQILAAMGWGAYFPYSVPALYSGVAGSQSSDLGIVSYLIVVLTSLAGAGATFAWWRWADQSG